MEVTSKYGDAPRHPDLAALTTWSLGYVTFMTLMSVAAVIGLAALITQWRVGLGITGLNTPTYWGLYVVNFVFLIGVSAGGIIVASLAHAFGLRRFEPVGRIAELLAITALVLAAIFITVDMGRPDRIFNLLLHGRWSSPLIWDFVVVTLYLATALALGYYGTRGDMVVCGRHLSRRRWLYRVMLLGHRDDSPPAQNRDRRTLRTLAWIALPGAVALHSVTAWIMGLLKSQAGWHNALLAPLFIVSAVVSGLALVTLVTALLRRPLRLRIPDDLIQDLGRMLAWGIPILGYFLFAEFLTVVYAGATHEAEIFHAMTAGPFAKLFWFDLIAGLLVPWLLLVVPGLRSVTSTGIAALLVVVGVLAERFLIVLPSLAYPRLPIPTVPYAPTVLEIVIVAGIYALGALVITVLAKVFPLVPLPESHEEA